MLQIILSVEDDRRHRGPVGGPVLPPSLREGRRGGGDVAQRAQVVDGAPLDGGRITGDGRQHVAPAQQVLRVGLVLDAQPDRGVLPRRGRGEHVAEPDGDRVRVDRHREFDRRRRPQRPGRLVVEEPGLAAEPYQPLAVRRGTARGPSADQDLARRRLKRLDALADRARRDVQLPCGRIERAVIGDGDKCVELSGVDVHPAS
jgi:hypothetical protein